MQPSGKSLFVTLLTVCSLATLPVATGRAAESEGGMDHSQHAGHHHMTAEQLATLRAKIELYAGYTDEQIMASMARMQDSEEYLSPAETRDAVGILALGHGYGDIGNGQFKAGYRTVAVEHPTAVALGMSMMDSAHIQKAVNELEAAGAKTIVVLPTEVGQSTSLVRQWHYIFGRIDESSYLDVPRVESGARIVIAQTPTNSPLVGEILADNVKAVSRDPASEAVVLIAHGPEDPDDNVKELANLGRQAETVKRGTGVAEIIYGTLQDDAPPAVRQANVDQLREQMQSLEAKGKRLIVAPVLMTSQGGVTGRIKRDLDGLDYELIDKGITEHALFKTWIEDTVATSVAAAN